MRDAFVPTSSLAFLGMGALLGLLLVFGYWLQRRPAWCAWALTLLGVAAAQGMTEDQPAGYRMLALCGAVLYGMKSVVGSASVRLGSEPLDARRWTLFSVAWMGMRPKAFHGLGGDAQRGGMDIAQLGFRNVLLGAGLLFVARLAGAREQRLLALLIGLPALSLLVHFGLFHLQAAYFRARGAEVGPLFRNPPLSRSLSEFWGRRWNLAFSEMTALAIHRPLRSRLGRGPAVTAAFLFSGLLHELAISGPVNAGWGLPLGYFGLHAVGMALERRIPLTGGAARVWTVAWIVLPLPLLFHSSFRVAILHPLLALPS